MGIASLVGAAALTPVLLQAQPTPVRGNPPSRTGPRIFEEICASCHGRDLQGGAAKSLFSSDFLKSRADGQLTRSIAKGPPGVSNHAFADLSEYQVYQTVAYLRLQGGNLNPKPTFVPNPNGRVIKSTKQTFRVEVVATGLETPWGLAFLPDGRLLVTERPGRLRVIGRDGRLSAPVKGTPRVFERRDAGMLDIAVHPDYVSNGWIYLSYVEVAPGNEIPPPPQASQGGSVASRGPSPPSMTVLIRGRLNATNEWVDTQEIWRAPVNVYTTAGDHYGSRFAFDGNGHLFFSIGERGEMANAQNLDNPLGKIHRINDDGTVPTDNPFYNTAGAVKTIWSYGHRNPQGLAIDPRTGLLWETEHGPTAGDEVNIVERARNYGWGAISNGLQPGITATSKVGMENPIKYYVPTVAPSGIRFYAGDKYPAWRNNLFVATLAGGALRRLEIRGRKIVADEILYDNFGRNRAVAVGPDGYLYALLQDPTGGDTGRSFSASTPGRVIRLTPVK